MATKFFKITAVCKEDILMAFEGSDKYDKASKRALTMTDNEMTLLAAKLADDYLNQLYWDSLRTIFEDKFMND